MAAQVVYEVEVCEGPVFSERRKEKENQRMREYGGVSQLKKTKNKQTEKWGKRQTVSLREILVSNKKGFYFVCVAH